MECQSAPTELRPSEPAIALRAVSKRFRLYDSAAHRVRDILLRRRSHHEHWALRGVDLEIRRGETVGIIGENGAGKSTLLSLVAGTSAPSEGEVRVSGRLSALLELGAGFHPEWTGRQNAEFYLRLNRTPKGLARARLRDIEAFADIGRYFDQPLRTYSSGMAVRVAFAAACSIEPEILIVDEALAVGDVSFQHKCFQRIAEFKARGVTILLVTHRLDLIPQICSRAILLRGGRMVFDGRPGEANARYIDLLLAGGGPRPQAPATAGGAAFNAAEYRMGTGGASIVDVSVASGSLSFAAGETASFLVRIRFDAEIEKPVFGFALRTVEDVVLYCVTSDMLGAPLPAARKDEVRTLRLDCPLHLPAGPLFADFSLSDFSSGEARILDGRLSMLRLEIRRSAPLIGLIDLGASLAPVEAPLPA
jgi:homopolymeric O-antigen transport system ATP-binding protein